MNEVFNPILPLNEYIPDGEPHVFGDRVYLYGSHDKENGDTFCELDYYIYSAPVDKLWEWSTKGISYSGRQDPLATEERHHLYAPDAVKGNDGRYYLYYCLSGYSGKHGYDGPIGVAVCDTPDGKYEFYGHVHYKDGALLKRFVPFDPAVINDGGVIRLYYGTAFPFADMKNKWTCGIINKIEAGIFNKSIEELQKEDAMGAVTCVLEDDMVTVKTEPVRIIPIKVKGTGFEKHSFFEGSSIRKIDNMYYFIYSSEKNHELCYATSMFPDRDFRYRGVIISNGDIGLNGITEKNPMNMLGNNHGSIEEINGKWYVFYHRCTNKSTYSRQACAEPIQILENGMISQVPMTSCGLNQGSLLGAGKYPAAICCNLTIGKMPKAANGAVKKKVPYIKGRNGKTIISDIGCGTVIGYKYFNFCGKTKVSVRVRGGEGKLLVCTKYKGEEVGRIHINSDQNWHDESALIQFTKGEQPLYFEYQGKQVIEFVGFKLEPQE